MLLYIIRHGDPIYETDTLTKRGKLQAEAVGKRIFHSKINKIFSSPMGRAKETAAPSCRLLNLECNIEEWAHEIEDERLTPFPDGELKSITKLQNTYFLENNYANLGYKKAFECQGINQSRMKEKVDFIEKEGNKFLERLGYKKEGDIYRIIKPNDDKVALFCHAAFSRAWISRLLHIPLNIMWASFNYTHTGVTIIEFKNNKNGITAPTCLCYSDMSHLYEQKLDLKYDNETEL
ncbi:MAG: histidine phosphatase family protein [Ruminococcaceae bacterium]|nr:histidine phosphatase family protein [Oscillospiraceae bacterium]